MKRMFSPRISAWLNSVYEQQRHKGTLTLLTAFMFMIFSALGLSLITYSQIYLRLCSYKNNAALLGYATENGIKQGLEQLSNLIEANSQPQLISAGEQNEFLMDAQNHGLNLLEKLLKNPLPLMDEGEAEKILWESQTSFSLHRLKSFPTYFSTTYRVRIESTGMLEYGDSKKHSLLEAELQALSGRIPLPSLPFLLGQNLTPEQKQNFLSDNNITITMPTSLPEIPLITDEEIIPQQADMLIPQALKIKIFSPQDLSPAILRQALGLEPSTDPVPDGVYLIRDDLGLGGIFVQGDLDELIFAIENDFQVVSFVQGQNLWILKFSPSLGKTSFQAPGESFSYDLVPRGIFIIEGKILSLGGGIIDTSGLVTLNPDAEIPCILRGVNLTIISSDTITLTAHLIHQGVKWQDGVPYLKDTSSQLNIFACGENIWGEDSGSGEIVIQAETADETKIQASLTAAKKGILIQGENQNIHVYGSIHTQEYSPAQNSLQLFFDNRFLLDETLLNNAPVTQNPLISLNQMRILIWADR